MPDYFALFGLSHYVISLFCFEIQQEFEHWTKIDKYLIKTKNIKNYLFNNVQDTITFSGNEHNYILNSKYVPKSHKSTDYQK